MNPKALVLVSDRSSSLNVERARDLLAAAKTTDEVKGIRDKAEAIRLYLRQQKASREAQNAAAEIKLRAERRLGELSAEMVRAPGGQPYHSTSASPAGVESKEATLREQGIAPRTAREWEKIAAIPEEKFEDYIADARESGEITTAGALRLSRGKPRESTDPETYPENRVFRWIDQITDVGMLHALTNRIRSRIEELEDEDGTFAS